MADIIACDLIPVVRLTEVFRQAAGSELAFRSRLEPIVFSALRSVLGEASLFTVLSEDRLGLMTRIRTETNRALERFGVEVVDVRIKRADLPEEPVQPQPARMAGIGGLAGVVLGAVLAWGLAWRDRKSVV